MDWNQESFSGMGLFGRIFGALFRGKREPLPFEQTSGDFVRFKLPNPAPRAIQPYSQPPPSAHVPARPETTVLKGHCWVIDGDTIVINKVHVRLSGIDAPELDHPLGQKAKWALHALCKGQVITATTDGSVTHDRAVAICHLPDGRDLAAEMVKAGLALDWPKYSGGRYAHLETEEARKKLWRASARQKGRMIVSKRDG